MIGGINMKRVEEIVKVVSPTKVEGPLTSVVSHITADSRTVQEGSQICR